MIDKVNICGIPHKVVYCEDNFDVDSHFGQIDYKEATIKVNKNMPKELIEETLAHEIVHGSLYTRDIRNIPMMRSLFKRWLTLFIRRLL